MKPAVNYVARWYLDDTYSRVAEITLAVRLRSPLNGSHGHWAVQAKRRREERHNATWGCSGPLTDHRNDLANGSLVGVSVQITRIAPRELDDDNLRASAKSIRDGITDALGLKNDRDPKLQWEYAQERGAPKQYAVRVTVRRQRPDAGPKLAGAQTHDSRADPDVP